MQNLDLVPLVGCIIRVLPGPSMDSKPTFAFIWVHRMTPCREVTYKHAIMRYCPFIRYYNTTLFHSLRARLSVLYQTLTYSYMS